MIFLPDTRNNHIKYREKYTISNKGTNVQAGTWPFTVNRVLIISIVAIIKVIAVTVIIDF